MTKIENRKTRRFLTVGVIILMLIALTISISSCSGVTNKTYDIAEKEMDDVHEFVARVFSDDTNKNYLYRFVAAYRGYDMAGENFEAPESGVVSPKGDADTTAATAVMKEMLEKLRFSEEGRRVFEEYAGGLTESTMKLVIDECATEYDLDANKGFFDVLLSWIGKALGALTKLVGNYYVVAIIIFALIVEILMLPVSIKQQKNSIGMAKLRPKIAKIEKKYAGRTDQTTLRKKQEEIMELQQKEGYSPFSGCLPLILQLVIVGFILYPIIQNPLLHVLDTSAAFSEALVEYATAPTAAGGLGIELSSRSNVIELLSILNKENMSGIAEFMLIENGENCLLAYNALEVPNFTAFGINLGKVPTLGFNVLILVPILNVVGQWASMQLTKKWSGNAQMAAQPDAQTNASMKMMDLVGPLMTLFIMFQVPALIGVYWFIRSMFSLAKQFIIKTVMPIPKYTEEELREMEKAEKERQKAQKAALKEQPKYRSLHYIDEDDYDELPEIKSDGKTKRKFDPSEAPEIKD